MISQYFNVRHEKIHYLHKGQGKLKFARSKQNWYNSTCLHDFRVNASTGMQGNNNVNICIGITKCMLYLLILIGRLSS